MCCGALYIQRGGVSLRLLLRACRLGFSRVSTTKAPFFLSICLYFLGSLFLSSPCSDADRTIKNKTFGFRLLYILFENVFVCVSLFFSSPLHLLIDRFVFVSMDVLSKDRSVS
jgi:hypothetical protein